MFKFVETKKKKEKDYKSYTPFDIELNGIDPDMEPLPLPEDFPEPSKREKLTAEVVVKYGLWYFDKDYNRLTKEEYDALSSQDAEKDSEKDDREDDLMTQGGVLDD